MNRCFVVGLAIVAASASGVAQTRNVGDDTGAFKTYFKELAPKVVAAYNSKDSKFFEDLYAPDFKSTDERGVTNGKKISLFLIRYHFNMLKKVDYKMKLVSLTASHDTAVLTLKTVINGVMQDRRGVPGSPMTLTRLEKQTFVKKGNLWMISLNQDIKPPALLLKPATQLKPAGQVKATNLLLAGGHAPEP